jgi:MFS family permease
MGGIVSANVLIVALASDVLHSGARGLGYLEAGWGFGAILGGLLASQLPQRLRLTLYGIALAVLAIGHVAMPLIAFLVAAVLFQILFGFCRALSGVVAQASLMAIVPRHFMGRTQSAIAIVTTIVQILMSLVLGWVSQKFSLLTGFSLLALLYVVGTISAFRARHLLRAESTS